MLKGGLKMDKHDVSTKDGKLENDQMKKQDFQGRTWYLPILRQGHSGHL